MARRASLIPLCFATLVTTAIAQTPTTVTVIGRVVHAVTGDPIGGADVSLNVAAIDGAQRKAISGDDGRFFIDNVPAGRYYLFAIKAGYFYAGLNDEGQPGASDLLIVGWPAPPSLTLRLRPHGAIVGTVLDDANRPVTGAKVTALVKKKVWPSWGQRWGWDRALNLKDGVTNANGQYVIEPLPAGEYLVQIDADNVAVPGVASKSYGTTYSSGTASIDAATPIRLGTGERRVSDVRVTAKPAFEISGVVVAPMADAIVHVQLLSLHDSSAHRRPVATQWAKNGSFRFTRVTPGDYALVANVNDDFRTEQRIRIDDRDLGDVQLRLAPAIVISGTIVWEGVDRPPERSTLIDRRSLMFGIRQADEERLRASQPILLGTLQSVAWPRPVGQMAVAYSMTWTSETTFTLRLLPGSYFADLRDHSGWLVKSLRINGRDATEEPVEINSGSTDAVLTMTRARGQVKGTAVLAPGTPSSFCVTVLFSTNRRVWPSIDASSRHVLVNAADENGRFEYTDVLPGEYYLAAVATLDLEGIDTDMLGRLAVSAQRVQVSATVPIAATLTCAPAV